MNALAWVFLAFQYPVEIPGVTIANFCASPCRPAREKARKSASPSSTATASALKMLEWDESIVERYLNAGFSGGEKKRNQSLQMLMLDPTYIIMDETDSGLDVDALKIVARGVNSMRGPDLGGLIITHYQRLSTTSCPTGCISSWTAKSCNRAARNWRKKLDSEGYDWVKELATA